MPPKRKAPSDAPVTRSSKRTKSAEPAPTPKSKSEPATAARPTPAKKAATKTSAHTSGPKGRGRAKSAATLAPTRRSNRLRASEEAGTKTPLVKLDIGLSEKQAVDKATAAYRLDQARIRIEESNKKLKTEELQVQSDDQDTRKPIAKRKRAKKLTPIQEADEDVLAEDLETGHVIKAARTELRISKEDGFVKTTEHTQQATHYPVLPTTPIPPIGDVNDASAQAIDTIATPSSSSRLWTFTGSLARRFGFGAVGAGTPPTAPVSSSQTGHSLAGPGRSLNENVSSASRFSSVIVEAPSSSRASVLDEERAPLDDAEEDDETASNESAYQDEINSDVQLGLENTTERETADEDSEATRDNSDQRDFSESTPEHEAEMATNEAEVDTDQAEMDTDQAEMATSQAEIDTNEAEMDTDQAEMATNEAEMDTDQAEMATNEIAVKDEAAEDMLSDVQQVTVDDSPQQTTPQPPSPSESPPRHQTISPPPTPFQQNLVAEDTLHESSPPSQPLAEESQSHHTDPPSLSPSKRGRSTDDMLHESPSPSLPPPAKRARHHHAPSPEHPFSTPAKMRARRRTPSPNQPYDFDIIVSAPHSLFEDTLFKTRAQARARAQAQAQTESDESLEFAERMGHQLLSNIEDGMSHNQVMRKRAFERRAAAAKPKAPVNTKETFQEHYNSIARIRVQDKLGAAAKTQPPAGSCDETSSQPRTPRASDPQIDAEGGDETGPGSSWFGMNSIRRGMRGIQRLFTAGNNGLELPVNDRVAADQSNEGGPQSPTPAGDAPAAMPGEFALALAPPGTGAGTRSSRLNRNPRYSRPIQGFLESLHRARDRGLHFECEQIKRGAMLWVEQHRADGQATCRMDAELFDWSWTHSQEEELIQPGKIDINFDDDEYSDIYDDDAEVEYDYESKEWSVILEKSRAGDSTNEEAASNLPEVKRTKIRRDEVNEVPRFAPIPAEHTDTAQILAAASVAVSNPVSTTGEVNKNRKRKSVFMDDEPLSNQERPSQVRSQQQENPQASESAPMSMHALSQQVRPEVNLKEGYTSPSLESKANPLLYVDPRPIIPEYQRPIDAMWKRNQNPEREAARERSKATPGSFAGHQSQLLDDTDPGLEEASTKEQPVRETVRTDKYKDAHQAASTVSTGGTFTLGYHGLDSDSDDDSTDEDAEEYGPPAKVIADPASTPKSATQQVFEGLIHDSRAQLANARANAEKHKPKTPSGLRNYIRSSTESPLTPTSSSAIQKPSAAVVNRVNGATGGNASAQDRPSRGTELTEPAKRLDTTDNEIEESEVYQETVAFWKQRYAEEHARIEAHYSLDDEDEGDDVDEDSEEYKEAFAFWKQKFAQDFADFEATCELFYEDAQVK